MVLVELFGAFGMPSAKLAANECSHVDRLYIDLRIRN